jgi:hypothetical protein
MNRRVAHLIKLLVLALLLIASPSIGATPRPLPLSKAPTVTIPCGTLQEFNRATVLRSTAGGTYTGGFTAHGQGRALLWAVTPQYLWTEQVISTTPDVTFTVPLAVSVGQTPNQDLRALWLQAGDCPGPGLVVTGSPTLTYGP